MAICVDGKNFVSHEKTIVRFRKISEKETGKYILSGEWIDKAGGYGIQGKASVFIEGIEGCYYNVVGFPVALFMRLAESAGIDMSAELEWE